MCPTELVCGVPQGSVFGPYLFTLYAAPIEDILIKHRIDFMPYADDTQLYITCKSGQVDTAKLETCVEDIREWMLSNKLVLNDSKTEIIHFHSKFRATNVLSSIKVGESEVHTCETVRDLGFYFDCNATMSSHVSQTCRSASFALHRIGKIRNILDQTTTERLVHAFITSRIDFCNSLLYKNSETMKSGKLQLLQNSAARLVTRTKINEHITPVLQQLHWLPVEKRVEFKLLVLTYKTMNGQAPLYLQLLLSKVSPVRVTRRSEELRLFEPKYN